MSPIRTVRPYLFCSTGNSRLTEWWAPNTLRQDKTCLGLTGLTFVAELPEICLKRYFKTKPVRRTKKGKISARAYCYKQKWISKSRGLTVRTQTRAYIRSLEHVQKRLKYRNHRNTEGIGYSGSTLASAVCFIQMEVMMSRQWNAIFLRWLITHSLWNYILNYSQRTKYEILLPCNWSWSTLYKKRLQWLVKFLY